jgi:hypothetical protein
VQVTNDLVNGVLNVVSLIIVKTEYGRRRSIFMMPRRKHYDLFWVRIMIPTHHRTDLTMDIDIRLLLDPNRPISAVSTRPRLLLMHTTRSSRHSPHWVPYQKQWPSPANSRLYRQPSRTHR